jgi:hypothetical protein
MMDGNMMEDAGPELESVERRADASRLPRFSFRWCRFSLQSILLLVVIISLALGWWRDHHRLQTELEALRNPPQAWDTSQVLGPPDTPGAGDISTAWASATPDGR